MTDRAAQLAAFLSRDEHRMTDHELQAAIGERCEAIRRLVEEALRAKRS